MINIDTHLNSVKEIMFGQGSLGFSRRLLDLMYMLMLQVALNEVSAIGRTN